MDDLQLLREFRSRTEEPDVDRALARLTAELDAGRGPARRRPRTIALLAAPVAAGAIAVLVLLSGPGGGSPSTADAAIIHRAAETLAPPPNTILHYKLSGDGVGVDSWQLTSAPYSFLIIKGPVGQDFEQAVDRTSSWYYDPTSNTIQKATRSTRLGSHDPIAFVRQRLDDGRARMLGSAATDGAATYEIELAGDHGFSSGDLKVFVDRRTYRPVLIVDPQRDGSVVRLRVVTFEYLPATAANRRLLSVTARHPDATIVNDQASKTPPGK